MRVSIFLPISYHSGQVLYSASPVTSVIVIMLRCKSSSKYCCVWFRYSHFGLFFDVIHVASGSIPVMQKASGNGFWFFLLGFSVHVVSSFLSLMCLHR